jgi:demethylmenaquinone methyltransferase/2-methoxy-6-polyprenyl-1,4-benzoquinol methylase
LAGLFKSEIRNPNSEIDSQLPGPMPDTIAPPKVDKSEERIRRMFGEISPRYDFLNHFLSGGTDWYWRWRAVRAAAPRGDAPILDVCSGTGDLALAYWKKGGGKVPVVGADFTQEMLVIADQKAAGPRRQAALTQGENENQRVPFVFLQADTQRLPFADGQFQIVCVAFGLRNVTDTSRGLREMIRVCQPGGKIVVLEFSLPTNRLLRGLYTWYFRNILPRIGQLLARNSQAAYNYLPESVSEFPYGEKLASLMKECGLATVTFIPLTCGIATLYIGEK